MGGYESAGTQQRYDRSGLYEEDYKRSRRPSEIAIPLQ